MKKKVCPAFLFEWVRRISVACRGFVLALTLLHPLLFGAAGALFAPLA